MFRDTVSASPLLGTTPHFADYPQIEIAVAAQVIMTD